MSDCSVFYYVNGDPLDGEWIDLDKIFSIEDVLQILAETHHIPYGEQGKPDYDCDLLVADIEGDLARKFYTRCGHFNLDDCLEVLKSGIDENVMIAFLDEFDEWDKDLCQNNYYGYFESVEAFAREFIEQAGLLNSLPENLRDYFDFEHYGNELLINDFKEYGGYYFHNIYIKQS